MLTLRVKRITTDPHRSGWDTLTHIGGDHWRHTVAETARNITSRACHYTVTVRQQTTHVTVVERDGQKFLRTAADDSTSNNLLSLPRWPQ